MRHLFTTSALSLLVLSLPQPAAALGDIRPAFFTFVSRACIHQDAAHRTSLFGQRQATLPDFAGWDKFSDTPVARCLKARRWVSAELCSSAAKVDVTQRTQVHDWFDAHLSDAKKLAPVFRFANSPEAAAGACPEVQPGD